MSTHVYHGLEAPPQYGVLFPTILLLVLLLGFTLMLLVWNFRLYQGHAYFFILLYCLFLVWAFVWQCKSPSMFTSFVEIDNVDAPTTSPTATPCPSTAG